MKQSISDSLDHFLAVHLTLSSGRKWFVLLRWMFCTWQTHVHFVLPAVCVAFKSIYQLKSMLNVKSGFRRASFIHIQFHNLLHAYVHLIDGLLWQYKLFCIIVQMSFCASNCKNNFDIAKNISRWTHAGLNQLSFTWLSRHLFLS